MYIHKHFYTNVYSNFILNSQKMKTTQLSVYMMEYYSRIKMNEFQNFMLTEKNQTKKDSMIPLESSYRKCITIKTESKLSGFQGVGEK